MESHLYRPEQIQPMRLGHALKILAAGLDPEPCWEWPGKIQHGRGYGEARAVIDGVRRYVVAHRLVYVLSGRAIPDGWQLDHLCRNRACVNPNHLEPVTASENTLRSDHSLRRRTHCKSGHELAGDNLIPANLKNGRRACLACSRERTKARRRERAA